MVSPVLGIWGQVGGDGAGKAGQRGGWAAMPVERGAEVQPADSGPTSSGLIFLQGLRGGV